MLLMGALASAFGIVGAVVAILGQMAAFSAAITVGHKWEDDSTALIVANRGRFRRFALFFFVSAPMETHESVDAGDFSAGRILSAPC